VVSNAAGNLNVFPTIPGRTITITLSTTDYFV
jgi:hypothetical protein